MSSTSQRACALPISKVGVRFARLEHAIPAAVRQALEAGEPRYIHRGMKDFVILKYPAPGTVAIVGKDGVLADSEPARGREIAT